MTTSIDGNKKTLSGFKELIYPYLGIKSKRAPDIVSLREFIGYIIDQIGENNTTISKPLLLYLSQELENIEEDYNDRLLEICKFFIERIRPKYTYFSDTLLRVCKLLAALYQADEDYINAGRVMASVDTEDQHFWNDKTFNIVNRCEWRIETAEFFLQMEDNTSATKHIQKCRQLMREIPSSTGKNLKVKQQLGLRYKSCYSRILDSEKNF